MSIRESDFDDYLGIILFFMAVMGGVYGLAYLVEWLLGGTA